MFYHLRGKPWLTGLINCAVAARAAGRVIDRRVVKRSALLPGAIGGLAGLLVASKSSRKLLAKYGTSALLAGGGAVAGTVLWNKYQQKMRAQNAPVPGANTPAAVPADADPRSVRLITALVFCRQERWSYR